MPDIDFEVFGSVWNDVPAGDLEALQSLPNVTIQGAFEGMASLPVSDAAAFLYTSKWDGIPIVLIEAIALGLPVVAPTVGSIPELVSEKTGYPVNQEDDPEAYVARLRELLGAPDAAAAKVRHGQDLVRTRHSLQHFERQLKSLPGYAIAAGDSGPA